MHNIERAYREAYLESLERDFEPVKTRGKSRCFKDFEEEAEWECLAMEESLESHGMHIERYL